jgi:hypothetical protein
MGSDGKEPEWLHEEFTVLQYRANDAIMQTGQHRTVGTGHLLRLFLYSFCDWSYFDMAWNVGINAVQGRFVYSSSSWFGQGSLSSKTLTVWNLLTNLKKNFTFSCLMGQNTSNLVASVLELIRNEYLLALIGYTYLMIWILVHVASTVKWNAKILWLIKMISSL